MLEYYEAPNKSPWYHCFDHNEYVTWCHNLFGHNGLYDLHSSHDFHIYHDLHVEELNDQHDL